jgi:hypothetical protein
MMSKGPLERRQRLSRICKYIINGGPSAVDARTVAAFKAAALSYAHTQYDAPEQVLKRLYCDGGELGDLMRGAVDIVSKELDNMETSSATGARYNRTRRPPDDDDDDDDELDDDDDNDIEKQADHHASTVANLLVEAGSFSHRAAALQHLLHKPAGQALLQRMSKAAEQTAKESNMDKIETVRDVVKRHGIVAVAKSIIDENRSYGITEHEFVELATEHAKSAHPELSGPQAFAKLYQIPEVWRACNLLKSMPFQVDVEPLVVGGADTRDLSDESKAIAQLKQLGRDRWPTASESQQFERALIDPVNHKLARRAVPIPQPTTQYPFPR